MGLQSLLTACWWPVCPTALWCRPQTAALWCRGHQTPASWPPPSHVWRSQAAPKPPVRTPAKAQKWPVFAWLALSVWLRIDQRVAPWDSSIRWYRRRRWRCAWWPGCATWAPCSRCSPPEQIGRWRASEAAWPRPSPSLLSQRLLPLGPTVRCCLAGCWRALPPVPQSQTRM